MFMRASQIIQGFNWVAELEATVKRCGERLCLCLARLQRRMLTDSLCSVRIYLNFQSSPWKTSQALVGLGCKHQSLQYQKSSFKLILYVFDYVLGPNHHSLKRKQEQFFLFKYMHVKKEQSLQTDPLSHILLYCSACSMHVILVIVPSQ